MARPVLMALGPEVVLRRDPQADLIPRFDGRALSLVPRKPRDAPVTGGLVAGQAVLDVDGAGELVGLSVLEPRKLWPAAPIDWSLPARASPHRLVVESRDGGPAELRYDAERKLFAVLWSPRPEAELFALGPRAYAAWADGRLVALLADLRGFDRA